MAETDTNQKRHIVIIGGGVIGCTTAYFLTRHPKYNPALHTVTLLEATSIASGASGKAGGLLGLWAYPAEIVPLSYRLHKELADEHGGAEKWGYRRVGCGSITAVVKGLEPTEEARRRVELAGANRVPKSKQSEANGLPVLKENGQPQASPGDAVASGPDVAAVKEDVTAPAATPIFNGSLNGDAPQNATSSFIGDTAPLPIQSSAEPISKSIPVSEPKAPVAAAAAAATNTSNTLNDDASKDWEKLPKQDDLAASLLSPSHLPQDLTWLSPSLVTSYAEMGRPGATETAQVHPYHFTTTLASLARDRGVDIRLGAKVTSIDHTRGEAGCVRGVEYLERSTNTVKKIEGVTDVVVTAGPWTGHLLPRTKVEGLRAHSVVWEADVTPYAVFTDIKLPTAWVPEHRRKLGQARRHRGNVDPEIYARPGNEVYACGEPDSAVPLPATADLVRADEAQCDDLVAYTATVSPALAAAPVKTKQACYLPRHMRFGEERPPLIGRTRTPGLWLAAGHTCWGIQNGPGTGCLMAELLLDGKTTSANIDKLDPRKYKI